MMEKKRMAALLAAVLFGMSAIPAGAVNLIDTDAAATDSAEHAELDLYGVRATVTDRQDGELTVSTETAGTVVVHIAEQTIIMDTQTGLPAGAQDIKKGDEVYLYCGEMMALSEPPQVYAKAILVNLTDEHEPASLLSAEQVKRNADGSLTVQASDGGLTLNIARNASVTPFGTKNKAKLEDIRMGTRFFAWYDTILESYPAQAGTDKVVLLPSEDDTFAIVIEGDIVAGEGRMTNGVAMVPLRLTAELCGFTVKWNAKDRTVHLTNGTVQTTVTIGRDAYFRATALPDADGMSRPGALGAAPYIAQSRTWVPAELFGLLGEQIEMRGDALYLGGVPNAFTGEADETNAFNIVCKDKTLDKGRMENGVAMVPLREVGEALGYTVTWDIENRQAKMNNGKVMTHINIGEDSYIRSVMNGDGTEAPVSFGAAPYFADGKTWVPAKLFELLGEQVEMKGNALYLGGTEN